MLLSLLVSLSGPALATTPTPELLVHGESGAARTAWKELMAAGCDLDQLRVWSPIEARVLRNTPYALRGYTFSSDELTALFRSDGTDYYVAQGKDVTLPADELACAQTLKAREEALRKTWTDLPSDLEAKMTRSGEVFRFMWSVGSRSAQDPWAGRTVSSDDGVWILNVSSSGCPEGVDDVEDCESSMWVRCEGDACSPGVAG